MKKDQKGHSTPSSSFKTLRILVVFRIPNFRKHFLLSKYISDKSGETNYYLFVFNHHNMFVSIPMI